MFNCCSNCGGESNGAGYIVDKGDQVPKFYTKFTDIKQSQLHDQSTSILKVNKSEFQTLNKSLKGKNQSFIDSTFTPGDLILGTFDNIKTDKWKRISQLVETPQLFNQEILPIDATQFENGSRSLHAALASLAQRPQIIKTIFKKQTFSQKGIYNFILRSKGKLEEIVIDDYVPVCNEGRPLFSKPNVCAIWPVVIQKALSKTYGSYQKLMTKIQKPTQIYQDLCFASAQTVKGGNSKQQQDNLWNKLQQNLLKGRPACGLTLKSDKIKWQSINLTQNQYYNLLNVATLQHKMGTTFRVVKLRNIFSKKQIYKGQGSVNDTLFWEQIVENDNKSRMQSSIGSKVGIFYMLFSDYLKYFNQTYISLVEDTSNYINQPLVMDVKNNGQVFEVEIIKDGEYTFIIDQNGMSKPKQSKEQFQQDGFSRITLLVIKYNGSKKIFSDYQFVDGTLKYNEQRTNLTLKLSTGKFLLYIKLDATINAHNLPSNACLAIYSANSCILKKSSQVQHPNLLKQVFTGHARKHKKQFYNDDLMWSSWKLFANGGFGYIVLGNGLESKQKFELKINQKAINDQNYILKKPFKTKGEQIINIIPGQEEIILLRVKNSDLKQINFPPAIDLKIVPLESPVQ